MKTKLFYSFFAFWLLLSSCSNNNSTLVTPTPIGTFSGQFTRLHKSSTNGKVDTLTANLVLTTTNAGLYKVTGDTSKVHAGSHGSFTLNPAYINFQDSTSVTVKPVKIHLSGLYQYTYDGTNFDISYSSDTLYYGYTLKKM